MELPGRATIEAALARGGADIWLARPEESGVVADLLAELARKEWAHKPLFLHENVQHLLEDPKPGCWFLLAGETKPVALAVIHLLASPAEGAWQMFLNDLVVTQTQRGKGWGTRLMEAIVALGRDVGVVQVFLHTDRKNKNAHAFYRKLGFKDIGDDVYVLDSAQAKKSV